MEMADIHALFLAILFDKSHNRQPSPWDCFCLLLAINLTPADLIIVIGPGAGLTAQSMHNHEYKVCLPAVCTVHIYRRRGKTCCNHKRLAIQLIDLNTYVSSASGYYFNKKITSVSDTHSFLCGST